MSSSVGKEIQLLSLQDQVRDLRAFAKEAEKAGVKAVCFDRNGYRYHGRVKALADAAREGGLSF